mmetsp:Transcript_121413/g.302977  ORF Transcript_121413/g.302977 Transcript_121413/m.302977 type:complete len:265 (+) Transcript_121413:1324-2118(+)
MIATIIITRYAASARPANIMRHMVAITVTFRTPYSEETYRFSYCRSMPRELIVRIEKRHSVAVPPALAYAFATNFEPFSTKYIIAIPAPAKRGTVAMVTPATAGCPYSGRKAKTVAPMPKPSPMKIIGKLLKPFCTLTIASAKRVASSSGWLVSYQPTSCRNTAFKYADLYRKSCRAVTVSMHQPETHIPRKTTVPKPSIMYNNSSMIFSGTVTPFMSPALSCLKSEENAISIAGCESPPTAAPKKERTINTFSDPVRNWKNSP